jgi:hypothetical protein
MGFFKKSFEIGGHVTTFWTFVPAAVQTAISAGLSAVTGYFGYQELGIARAIFLATGVMAFGMMITFLWMRISQISGVYQRISVMAFGVPNFGLDVLRAPTVVTGLNMQCLLRNDSQVLMFYQLKRAGNVMERRVPANTKVDNNIVVIPPNGGAQIINFATIENIPFSSKKELVMSGSIDMLVAYGPAKDDLCFLFHYAADTHIVFAKTPDGKNHAANMVTSITAFEHSKV